MANEPEEENNEKSGLSDKISGTAQVIIGEIETIGGVLTADPVTQAEGELNVEVGKVREDIEADLEEDEANDNE